MRAGFAGMWVLVFLSVSRIAQAADGPDLIVTSISLAPSPPKVGTDITYTVTVKNQGTVDAKATFYIALYVDGYKCDEFSVSGGLYAGKMDDEMTHTQQCQPLVPGQHKIKAVVDTSNTIAEKNESNNELVKTFTWEPMDKPDLFIQQVKLDPQSPVVGKPVKFWIIIGNQGTADANKTFYYRFYLDKVLCEENKVDFGIKKGEHKDIDYTGPKCFPTTPWQHWFEISLDTTQTVDESDEDNNTLKMQIKWYPAPGADLVVSTIAIDPPAPDLGEPVSVTARVENAGESKTTGGFWVSFFLDGKKCDDVPADALDAGDSADVTTDAPECQPETVGTHTYTVVADPDETITEVNEYNNEKSANFVWGGGTTPAKAPNLVPLGVQMEPEPALAGEAVVFRSGAANVGAEAAPSAFKVAFYLDGKKCYQQEVPAGLAPGDQSLVATIPGACAVTSPGGHTLRVVADDLKAVLETDEADNAIVFAFVACLPETCNGQDDDCDGKTDEDCGCTDGAVEPCPEPPDACAKYERTCKGNQWQKCTKVPGTDVPGCAPGADPAGGTDLAGGLDIVGSADSKAVGPDRGPVPTTNGCTAGKGRPARGCPGAWLSILLVAGIRLLRSRGRGGPPRTEV